ncbi:GNAT family N-acetyltransferase [Nocardia aobensis]|uniref:GNAT family N-acetyltransferase n=1 Tax=Nocardia aobensis TaxID=257277 RepID=A0ABW6PDQ7_9NOCA
MPRLTPPTMPPGSFSNAEQPTVLMSSGIRLRPWTDADAPVLLDVYADAEIQRWHCKTLTDITEAGAMIAQWRNAWASGTDAHWAVADGDDSVVGRIALRHPDFADGNAGVAYWAVPVRRGRGIIPAAVIALTQWAFDRRFQRLSLEHSTENAPSCRVAHKAGYRYEGTLAAAAMHLDGRHDMHLHAITSDPKNRRPAASPDAIVRTC